MNKFRLALLSLILLMALNLFVSHSMVAQHQIRQTALTLEDEFPKRLGSLRFTTTLMGFGNVSTAEVKRDTMVLYNEGEKTVRILNIKNCPPHIKIQYSNAGIGSGTRSLVVVDYDGSAANDFGFVFNRINVETDDVLMPVKTLNITAKIREYFSSTSPEDSLRLPKAGIDNTVHAFGKVKAGEKVIREFRLYNEGVSDLIIRKVKASCSCLKAATDKMIIPQGSFARINVVFDSFGKFGKENRPVQIFVNDPLRPEIIVELQGEVIQ